MAHSNIQKDPMYFWPNIRTMSFESYGSLVKYMRYTYDRHEGFKNFEYITL